MQRLVSCCGTLCWQWSTMCALLVVTKCLDTECMCEPLSTVLQGRHYAAKPIKANILNVNIEYLGHISTPEGLKPPGAGVKHQLHKAQRTRRNKGVLPTRRRREI